MKGTGSRFAIGILVSLLLHAMLLALMALFPLFLEGYGECGPEDARGEPPRLEITQVELSFSAEKSESSAANASPPVPMPVERLLPPQPDSRIMEQLPLKMSGTMPEIVEPAIVNAQTTKLRPKELEVPALPRNESTMTEEASETSIAEPSGVDIPFAPILAATELPATTHSPDAVLPPVPPVAVLPEAMSPKGVASVPVPFQSAPAPMADAPAHAVGQVVRQPTLRGRIPKSYPSSARKRGEEGDVTLELSIDAHGVVIGVKVVASCGFEDLEKAALNTAKKLIFRPASQGDETVPSVARLTWSFKLRDKD